MADRVGSTRVVVPRRQARLATVARAALELTESCYVWLDKTAQGWAVTLTEKVPAGAPLAARFAYELERLQTHESLEAQTAPVRAALLGHALAAPARAPAPSLPPPAPPLDAETEAEIEKLLAEIDEEGWLDTPDDIAKTWEERFGAQGEGCEEEKS
jgi:hypothetical protein